jgi:hypothetical protein
LNPNLFFCVCHFPVLCWPGFRTPARRAPALPDDNINLGSRYVAAALASGSMNLRDKTPFDWRQRVIEKHLRMPGWTGD